MVKIIKKINLSLIVLVLVYLLLPFKVNADSSGAVDILHNVDATSNFFTQVEDKTQIEIVDKRDSLLINGYIKACENEYLEVYFKSATFGLAVYDKINEYTWFSTYEKVETMGFTPAVQAKIESGIVLEYYLVDSKGAIKDAEIYYSAKEKGSSIGSCSKPKLLDNGFDVDVTFKSYGISFKVELRIDRDKLQLNVPYESIKEQTVGTLNPKDYKLKSISLFPYLGSENFEINGYSFVPDGSGALIRYTDNESSTAYIKKLYGDDYSFANYPSSNYIKENGTLNLPIYGVNHGYNQASFLCVVASGLGSIELHSYPYMYSRIPVNTTFFKYYVRDTFTVSLSQSTMYLLNEDPYPTDYSLTYQFLQNEKANYVGMANSYREFLELNNNVKASNDIPLRLEILGIDYKPGLFGKRYVTMTKFDEALDIIIDLENNNVKNFNITYLGWNRGGYFTKSATNAKAATLLGGKKKLLKLSDYLSDKDYYIDYTINPLVSSTYGFGVKSVKRIGLSPFDVTLKSSLEQKGYYVLPTELSSLITSKDKKYQKLNITNLKIDNLNVCYSYRYKSNAIYRSQMIEEVVNEVKKLDSYNLSSEKPNSYLLPYVNNYYEAYYESNKFIYETDSIPFMSILLSGYVNQYIPNINYISDYELAVLRMIEYNLYPSFIMTKEEAYDLRYTNFEYLNSTQYDLWKDLIIKMYTTTNDALKYVSGANIVSHEAVLKGVSKVGYSNGVIIYVNYNNDNVNYDGISLPPYSYYVKGGA